MCFDCLSVCVPYAFVAPADARRRCQKKVPGLKPESQTVVGWTGRECGQQYNETKEAKV